MESESEQAAIHDDTIRMSLAPGARHPRSDRGVRLRVPLLFFCRGGRTDTRRQETAALDMTRLERLPVASAVLLGPTSEAFPTQVLAKREMRHFLHHVRERADARVRERVIWHISSADAR